MLRASPSYNVTAVVLDRIRREILSTQWAASGAAASGAAVGSAPAAPFASPECLTLLYEVLSGVTDFSVDGVTEQSQLHGSIVNYLRALLLKEKRHVAGGGAAVTGVWDAAALDRLRVGYVNRLCEAVRKGQAGDTAAAHDNPLWILEASVLPVVELMGA